MDKQTNGQKDGGYFIGPSLVGFKKTKYEMEGCYTHVGVLLLVKLQASLQLDQK